MQTFYISIKKVTRTEEAAPDKQP